MFQPGQESQNYVIDSQNFSVYNCQQVRSQYYRNLRQCNIHVHVGSCLYMYRACRLSATVEG